MAEPQTPPAGAAQKSSGRGIVDRVKETAAAQLGSQKDRGTDALGRVADAVRSTTQKLREDRHETIAGYIDQAANSIENWAERLREKDVEELVGDMQRFARRQPIVFIGSAFAVGLLAARFLKSSRPDGGYQGGAESRRTMYGGGTAGPSTVHDYSGRDRETDAGTPSELATSDLGFESGTSSTPGGGAEVAARPSRTRRSPSRTGQS